MIQRVRIKNYRSLGDVEVELGPLTVLVGPNASGKSNFVDALKFTSDALNSRIESAIVSRRGFAQLSRYRAKVLTLEFLMDVRYRRAELIPERLMEVRYRQADLNPAEYAVELEADRNADTGFRIRREHCWVGTEDGEARYATYRGRWLRRPVELEGEAVRRWFSRTLPVPEDELALRSLRLFPPFHSVERQLQGIRSYTVFPQGLRADQAYRPALLLDETGDNLASVLKEQFSKESTSRIRLINALSSIVESASGFEVQTAGDRLVIKVSHYQPGGRAHAFDAAVESDGTLRVLALLAALYQKRRPALTIIEEPELHLQPGAMGVLADVLREASLRGQILVTTQSADLMNELESDELRVVEKLDGVTHIGPVDDEHRKSVEMELFTPGDLIRVRGFRRKAS